MGFQNIQLAVQQEVARELHLLALVSAVGQAILFHLGTLLTHLGHILRTDHLFLGSSYAQLELLVEAHVGIADNIERQVFLLHLGIDGGSRALQNNQQLSILGLDAVIGVGILTDVQLAQGAAIVTQEQKNSLLSALCLLRELYIALKRGVKRKSASLQPASIFAISKTSNIIFVGTFSIDPI